MKYYIVIFLFLWSSSIIAQKDLLNIEAALGILENKQNHTSDEIVLAYQSWAARLHMVSGDSALQVYQLLIDYVEENELKKFKAKTYLQMGEVYYMQGETPKAKTAFLKTLEYLPHDHTSVGGILRRLSDCYMHASILDSADYFAKRSAEVRFRNQDTTHFSSTYNKLGQIAFAQNKYITATEFYTNALHYSNRAPSPLIKLETLRNLSNVYSIIGDDQKGKSYIEQALHLAEASNYKRTTAELSYKLAAFELSNHPVQAENHILKSLNYYESKNNELFIFICQSMLANLYVQWSKFEETKKALEVCRKLLPEIDEKNFTTDYYKAVGYLELEKENFVESERMFSKVLAIGIETGAQQAQISAWRGMRSIGQKSHKYKDALFAEDQIQLIRDSIYQLKQSQIIFDFEGRYQKAEKEKAIENLNAENRYKSAQLGQQRKQLIYGGFGLLGLLGLAIGLGYAYRQKKKNADALAEKNRIIAKTLETNRMLIKEIHHRVKNNLQVVSSLLNLQSRYVDDDSALAAINTGRSRVESMSLLHQNLYQGESLKNVKIKDYFEDLGEHLFDTYKMNQNDIEYDSDIDDLEIDIDIVVPMGLIVNELISNALKHAFKEKKEGRISLSIKETTEGVLMKVEDNGIGLPFNTIPKESQSLGMQLIKAFADKLNGSIQMSNKNGASISILIDPEKIAKAA